MCLKYRIDIPILLPAVQNQGVGTNRFKMIDLVDKDIFVKDVEVRPVVDAQGVVQTPEHRARLLPPSFFSQPRKVNLCPLCV